VESLGGFANFDALGSRHVRRAFELIDEHMLGGHLSALLQHEHRVLTFRVAPRIGQAAAAI